MAEFAEGLRCKNPTKMLMTILFLMTAVVCSYIGALSLRFDGTIPLLYQASIVTILPLLLLIKIPIFWTMGLFSGGWKYISLPDLLRIVNANLSASLLLLGLYVLAGRQYVHIPPAVFVLDGLFCFLTISGARVLARIGMETVSGTFKQGKEAGGRVLVVGAGAAGQTIAREIRQTPSLNMTVIGFLDCDPERLGENYQGVPVLGAPQDLVQTCWSRHIGLVIVAQPAVGYRELRTIVAACRRARVESKILPTVGEIIKGAVSVRHMRDVQLEDLLGRRPVELDVDKIQGYLKGKRILVTGAGGSIGSEICRQVLNFSPAGIVLLDSAETPLFNVERELHARSAGVVLTPSLSDIRDEQKIRQIFARHRPEVVFHAAAYKHVPMLESHPYEAISNNVMGTRILANAAHAAGVSRFVMVSTDKAVNPTNVMGASKRAAEIYVQYLARRSATNFITVRFGNVLGSNGSVIPVFRDQIEQGGPVTVTHPEVTRFFMTIPEAAQLVLQAGSMGRKGEIFLLDMGEPVKILELAEELIRLSGLRPYKDIDIVFSGLRPGEKLYEELLLAGEDIQETAHDKIFVAKSRPIDENVSEQWFLNMAQTSQIRDSALLIAKLREIVPEYRVSHASPVEVKITLPQSVRTKPAPPLPAAPARAKGDVARATI
ncbi:MAG: hypothetical protein A2091_12660 [Desulfuromonadales bacterium GWD2_61_12]|nr:MAG: hypothetical protein A2005_11385 [Desulfuromonadales bacterium GWC2_61_20]OGR36535.1 MAG: hypothetical protein A2091_12660 [Desulfuromonadales bacterium GWD2_61_12]HAD05073.1 nucleoside-diphosphate sugar epimerase [Desulfuromonas sp.]HBT83974.1 nucleoside-diphosphate sugar epimerase [Desulfuromonas sp.]